ncbi:aldo-keto reductase, putative [Dendryphion nanum]|uniref:Aldo-keto reductase, putative n=1 Tax=Dendryphion nanum TaxID=256645 RepID=A0A9P9INN4_9PLEO|nr:aldo-keto reductase, putative [Dendryphion nanum]
MTLPTAALGKDSPQVPRLGLGPMSLSKAYEKENIFLATNYGRSHHAHGSVGFDSGPGWAKEACNISLPRFEKYSIEGLVELKNAGKVSCIGFCECSSETLRRADLPVPAHRKLALRFSEENFPKNLALVRKLIDFAKKKGVMPSQLVLAGLLANGEDIFPIPGMTNLDCLKENVEGANVKLAQVEMEAIRKACNETETVCTHYSEIKMAHCFADIPTS